MPANVNESANIPLQQMFHAILFLLPGNKNDILSIIFAINEEPPHTQ